MKVQHSCTLFFACELAARIATPQIAKVADQLDSVVSAVEEIHNVHHARIEHENRVQRWYYQLRTVVPSFVRGEGMVHIGDSSQHCVKGSFVGESQCKMIQYMQRLQT